MPKHVDIANALRERIRAGEFPVGTMLPGVSELEAEYGAALNTIRAAEGVLRKEGLLRITQGVGAEVIALPAGNERQLIATIRTALNQLEAALDARDVVPNGYPGKDLRL
ncbi:GntR family transcriptional regulator [Actinoplanes sp. CA-054009]